MEYLEETHPQPALLPADSLGRARVRSLSLIVACEIHPLNNPRVLKYVRNTLSHSQDEVDVWYRHWIADGLAKLEAELRRPGTGRHCHGDAPSMADCCLVPQIFNAQRFECDLKPYPAVMRVYDACMRLEAFDRAQPNKQPDAESP
jgi:maleylacetoacetate isomerase